MYVGMIFNMPIRCVDNIPTMQFPLDFPKILSINPKKMHCGILLNMPYVDWLSSVQLTLMSSSLLASSRLSLSLFSRSSNVSAIVGGSLLVPPACTTDSGLLLSVEAAGGSIESTRAASACSFRSVVLKLIYILISHSAQTKNKWRWWRPHYRVWL